MLCVMSGATGILIKLAVRLVVFSGVFFAATRYIEGITVTKKWAFPLLGALFAVLTTLFYWLLAPLLDLATFNALSLGMPLVVNLVLLAATMRLLKTKGWLQVDGFFSSMWLALALTAAHGALWISLDYLPAKL
jgi:hypothetical protein